MLKETITYKDYNDVERTEDFYFNLSETEIIEMTASSEGDLSQELKKMVESKDGARIMKTFKDLVARAYGEKSADGKRFMKSPEISRAFFETPAYNQLFMRLVTDPDFAAKFVNGIIPQVVTDK